MNNIHKTSGFGIKTRVRKTHMHSEFLKTSTAITSICTSGCTKQKIFWCVPLPTNLNYKIHFWAKTRNFLSTFQKAIWKFERMQSTEIKTILASCFFPQQLTIFLVLHFVPGAVTTSVVQLLLSPKKRNCDLHCPKNNNNNNNYKPSCWTTSIRIPPNPARCSR